MFKLKCLGFLETITLPTLRKNIFLKEVLHQGCLQNMSAIPPGTPDLCTCTKEKLHEKLQNPPLVKCDFLWPCILQRLFP